LLNDIKLQPALFLSTQQQQQQQQNNSLVSLYSEYIGNIVAMQNDMRK